MKEIDLKRPGLPCSAPSRAMRDATPCGADTGARHGFAGPMSHPKHLCPKHPWKS